MSKPHHDPVISVVPGSFHAILDTQPGAGAQHTFFAIVDIAVQVDWKVQLVSAVPQGIIPADKLLRFHVVKPAGSLNAAVTKRTVRYDEAPPKVTYAQATLENGPRSQTVQVEIVV